MRHERLRTNGITLHVAIDGPESGPLVVLLHGFPEAWFGWRRQIPHLVERGFCVVAPDQRGYNESDKPSRLGAYVLDELARDVLGLIDALGRERAMIVGHDWGAAVAWWTAMFHPERVERLAVLNVPHPTVMRTHLLTDPRQIARSWYMFFFQLPWLPERVLLANEGRRMAELLKDWARPGTFDGDDVEMYRRAWLQPGAAHGMISWYRAIRRAITMDVPEDTMNVKMPAMLIWGRDDPILGEVMAIESIQRCKQGRLELIDGAGHFVQHDAPERVNTLLAEHLG